MSEPAFYRPVVDDSAAYREAIRKAEEDAGFIPDGFPVDAPASVETPAIAELVEAVPVQASDQPLTPEPAEAETVEETPVEVDTSEQQQETLFAGKYKSLEDLEKAHLELQQKLGDPNRLDLENRRLQEQLDALSAKIDAAQTVTPQAPAVPITQDFIDNDPERATLLAFEQGNQAALEIAFNQWKSYDSDTANQWLTGQRLAQQQREFDAKLAEVQKAIDEKTAPLAAQQEEQAQNIAWKQAFDTAKAGRPDFIDNAARLLADVAQLYPSLLPNLESADPKVKADALIALYAIDKIGNPEAVAAQLGEKAKEAAVDAAAALAAGAVVSGQTTTGQVSEDKTEAQLEADRYVARMGSTPSLSRGWTGRS